MTTKHQSSHNQANKVSYKESISCQQCSGIMRHDMPVTMLREDAVSMVRKYESPVLRYFKETTAHEINYLLNCYYINYHCRLLL